MTELGITAEQGLVYEDLLPLKWHLDTETSLLDKGKFDALNEEVLRFIEVLDEHPSESVIEHSPINQELAKVEVKFDLLLSLVNQLLGVYFPLPDPVPVKLTSNGVQWVSNSPINLGASGQVEIYLSRRCPRSLIFPARVDSLEKEGRGYLISAQFGEFGSAIKERLEKMIFRQHRRSVASARRKLASNQSAQAS